MRPKRRGIKVYTPPSRRKVRIRCVECMEAGVYKPAEYLLYDNHPHQFKPLCREHFTRCREEFGEVSLSYSVLSEDDLETVLLCTIEKANEVFKWYEDMLKRLYAEIKKLKGAIDWIAEGR